MYGQKSGLEAAVAAAAKVDASLHAKGKLTKSLSEGLSKSDVSKIIQAEFSINHVPQSTRNLLCKGSTQEIIKDFSGACVSTKGRYIPESERKSINLQDKTAKNLGLYLFIQGPSKRSIDLAIQKIEEMIASNAEPNTARNAAAGSVPTMLPATVPGIGPMPVPVSLPGGSNNASGSVQPLGPDSGGIVRGQGPNVPPSLMSLTMQLPPPMVEQHPSGKFVEKIPIGMENVLPGFNLPMKLIGQGGSNLNYIKNETGAIVTLRGVGSAFLEPGTQQEAPEPLHFCITHHKPEVMATARDLALNLIATVQQEYIQFQMQQPPPQNPAAQIQQVNVEPPPNLVLHQPGGAEHSIIQQPIPGVTATSISLPVVQTGFIQQPAVTQLNAPPPMVGVPPPHFSQPPPPAQVALPPPGVHIPQQQGPLVSPVPQQLQIQPQHEQPNNFVQQITQPFQPGQQQYVITQNGQPMQGIMTSQGLVVLNQQPQPTYTQQQVFLSQPPPVGQAQPVFQPGQPMAFQSTTNQPIHASVTAPVSYQFQYVQQNPPPTMTYSAVQNPLLAQSSHLQIQQPQHQAVPQNQIGPNTPQNSTGQSPIPNHHQTAQNNPQLNQPPPSLPNQSPTMQNPPPSQRHSPNLQGPPPNQHNPNFSMQSNPNQMILQQIPNHQMIPNNQPVPIQNQNIQAVPVSTANFIPGHTQLMQIQGIRPPNEVLNPQFQLQQPNYNQYQQQIVMKQVQVCQPQQLQFVPGYPPGPVQILPAAPGPFIPPPQQQQQQQSLPQFNQNQETPPESKPQKRKFTEEISPPLQQGQPPPQSLMSIPMQPPQPVPPPAQTVSNSASPARQGVGVQELMIMNQQQRQQHLQQPEGLTKDSSQKGEESAVVPPPPPSTGNQSFAAQEAGPQEAEKVNQQRQWFEENQANRDLSNRESRENRHESERDQEDRNCGYTRRRDRPTFSHYSSKPQMYDTMSQYPIRNFSMCPPPPPPPPPLINQPQHPSQQPPTNYYYHQNTRPY